MISIQSIPLSKSNYAIDVKYSIYFILKERGDNKQPYLGKFI